MLKTPGISYRTTLFLAFLIVAHSWEYKHLTLPFAVKLGGAVDFIFRPAPSHTVKNALTVVLLFLISQRSPLNWTQFKTNLELLSHGRLYSRTNNENDLKSAFKATWGFMTCMQRHRLMASKPRRIDPIRKLQASIKCHIRTLLFWIFNFLGEKFLDIIHLLATIINIQGIWGLDTEFYSFLFWMNYIFLYLFGQTFKSTVKFLLVAVYYLNFVFSFFV